MKRKAKKMSGSIASVHATRQAVAYGEEQALANLNQITILNLLRNSLAT
jgi:hypothetical protein